MEKVGNFKTKILVLLGIFLVALAFSAALPQAEAGTVFVRPQPVPKLGPGEIYPESRFGEPPAPVPGDDDSSYAAVEDEGPSRSPAGLVFGRTRTQTVTSAREAAQPSLSDATSSLQSSSLAARKGVQEVALIASDLGFFPKTVFVSRDVPVRMFVTGASKNTLCLMMDSFQVRRQVRSQKIEEITFTPNVPGKYRFYCPVNGMEGTLIVKEFASSPSASSVADNGVVTERSREPASE